MFNIEFDFEWNIDVYHYWMVNLYSQVDPMIGPINLTVGQRLFKHVQKSNMLLNNVQALVGLILKELSNGVKFQGSVRCILYDFVEL